MTKLEQIRQSFRNDLFATEAVGIEIVDAQPQYARCEMPITPVHKNARGTPMGGAIFTLADFASAVAANGYAEGTDVISLHADITYLGAAKGERLIAISRCIKHGRSTTLYDVEVTDELGTMVAHVTMNGFVLNLK